MVLKVDKRTPGYHETLIDGIPVLIQYRYFGFEMKDTIDRRYHSQEP